ncbi:MAG: UDP-N-acetylmuramoyl-L-alanine--D-glutamate ligase [Candidatus Dactylopiibacterium carminicum]|uniref:UDP-N-acetylmuramoylalanine--D-glutamate ligase n=1 Tax=Candidatus Dactylopiibacterium carminicum TaxID=857335 RepID=A0A272EQN8_9RHOO|nr:UDP-N-acetylmuramoyl-L-alanine--D-glutamate ligase [Candidatus Dactylopiibacterium carminicum]KAF7599277.1 UDP-N-acetylmuramoyl-L-alanine--D-glutamate ligase [Candidatus Dactylopiibacterium carminicum]PAS92439.1 MAG: UDP-N-acetylmuramoyl-L-alanine--D-glutamate ligase [Candidatus Dactylopiibacterium carminicum]PAS97173.1 MAG: UDP-N-acetylmuramoyl-L-alanine--D-glutamate ligase [Candidatus Dactylopiibacterium carminicum]PAS99283.1 MAG: UDP-N-acetylmuramoylalanine--D-glutamate ligase [Candidatus
MSARTLILGLGETGLAMARWLTRQGRAVRVADSRAQPPGVAELRAAVPGAELHAGPFGAHLLEGIDEVAVSPGLPLSEPLIEQARMRGLPVLGEIELFTRALATLPPARVLAITGTNGKTTTTALTGELVRACGLDAAVAGNISPAALTELLRRLDDQRLPDVWVLELSSFQLETTDSLRADAAVVLNVTDDHLDRHGTMQAYADIKSKIFAGDGLMLLNREDALVAAMRRTDRRAHSFGLDAPADGDYGVCDGSLCRGAERLLAANELQLVGSHNIANALAALALCEAIGLPRVRLLQGLRNFRGLPHRVERVASRADGVDFYDDSKGTNVGATLAALQGLGRKVVLIAGGDGKGQDFSPLAPALREHARAVLLIGRDAARLHAETAASGVPFLYAGDMDEAVVLAAAQAQAGDAVLLSPACASLDMFRNYAHRAEVFIAAVHRLPGVQA